MGLEPCEKVRLDTDTVLVVMVERKMQCALDGRCDLRDRNILTFPQYTGDLGSEQAMWR